MLGRSPDVYFNPERFLFVRGECDKTRCPIRNNCPHVTYGFHQEIPQQSNYSDFIHKSDEIFNQWKSGFKNFQCERPGRIYEGTNTKVTVHPYPFSNLRITSGL